MTRHALISIRPPYVDAIFSGAKTVELRRKIPAVEAGTRLWIYSTMPVGALVGTADISAIEAGSPEHIWALHSQNIGVCRAQFEAYYQTASIAYGISLQNVRNGRPVNIARLRQIRPRFHPPQVMLYMTSDEVTSFHSCLFGEEAGND